MRRSEAKLREADRKLAATRGNEHGRLANRLLAEHGAVVHAEKLSYRAWQRSGYGRSLRDRAPRRFMRELQRKAADQGGTLVEIPTVSTFLSQRCVCGRRQPKPRSQRRHRCGCEHVPAGRYADRDELAAFLACFCDERGAFDSNAALEAWQGGANDRLLRAEKVREPAAKPQASRSRGSARTLGQSSSAGKRQRTPVTPRRANVRGKPRGHGRATRTSRGTKPPGFSRGDH